MHAREVARVVGAVPLLMAVGLVFMYPWQRNWSTGVAWLWMAGVAALVVAASLLVPYWCVRARKR